MDCCSGFGAGFGARDAAGFGFSSLVRFCGKTILFIVSFEFAFRAVFVLEGG
jgi:hypothetical protein